MPNPTSKILAEWAQQWPGAAADVRNVRPDADPVEVLMVFHMADGPRDALKALILRRLDGAERAQTLAEHWQNVGTLCPLSAAGRELKEALDG